LCAKAFLFLQAGCLRPVGGTYSPPMERQYLYGKRDGARPFHRQGFNVCRSSSVNRPPSSQPPVSM